MAERKTDDDFNPRHRIVGAVILVALAVIFLPLLLQERAPEKESAGQKEVSEAVSPANTAKPQPDVPRPTGAEPATARPNTRTVTVALDPAEITKPAKKPAIAPVTAAEPVKPESKPEPVPAKAEPKVEVRQESKPESKPEAKPKAKTETSSEPRTGGWYVQVGVFSQADNARRLQEKLAANGFHVVTDPPRIEKGKTIKVEVGPYADQSAAKTAATRIKSDHGVDGVVRKH